MLTGGHSLAMFSFGVLEGAMRDFLDAFKGVVIDTETAAEWVVERDDEGEDQADGEQDEPEHGSRAETR